MHRKTGNLFKNLFPYNLAAVRDEGDTLVQVSDGFESKPKTAS